MKRIISVTGTRADYGIYRPVYRAIAASPDFSLGLVVTGMHLLPEFGETVKEVSADGFEIVAEINTLIADDRKQSMAEYIGRSLVEEARILAEQQPDIVLLLGDRGEQLAAAIAALELSIPIAHLHGGELTGTVDDPVRHAITQMASIHLTTAQTHADYVRQIKPREHPANIHVVGAPALDVIRSLNLTGKKTLCTEVGLDPAAPLLLFLQHPDTDEQLSPLEQLQPALAALTAFEGNIVAIGANADAGGVSMNARLKAFIAERSSGRFFPSLPHHQFLSWLAAADVLVGNSSSGIIEAASFHRPVVNVGGRQRGRLRSCNVLDVPYEASAITAAINQVLHDRGFRSSIAKCSNAYGDGNAAARIVAVLQKF